MGQNKLISLGFLLFLKSQQIEFDHYLYVIHLFS